MRVVREFIMLALMRRFLTQASVISGHPVIMLLVAIYWFAWWYFDRDALSWHSIATMATLFMTLFLQRAENMPIPFIPAQLSATNT